MFVDKNYSGSLLILAGMFILAIVDNYVRLIASEIGLWQFHLLRSIVAIFLMFIFLQLFREALKPQNFWLVVLRTLILVLAMFVYFGSLAFFPISQVAAGLFTSPIFVVIFSIFFLKEAIDLNKIMAILVGSCGVILVLGLNTNEFSAYSGIPILAGLFYALASITLKRWCSTEKAALVMLMFFFGMGFVALIMTIMLEINDLLKIYSLPQTFLTSSLKVPSAETVGLVIFHAIGSIIGGLLITLGYQRGETSFVSSFEYSFLFFVTLWGYVAFSEQISSPIFLGLVLILFSGVLLSFSKSTG